MRGKCLNVVSLTSSLSKYIPVLQLQERLVADRKAGTAHDTLLLVQHHPVFTIGKRGTKKDVLTNLQRLGELGIDVVHVARGGETTYHGPGQLVAYPIVDLRQLGLGARAFVECLEDAMIHTVGCFGIQAKGRVPGKTGVWVGERKIGAVGVRITHGISSHGIALNVTTELGVYQHIVPCGTPDKEVTSLWKELHRGQRVDGTFRQSKDATAVLDQSGAATGRQQCGGCCWQHCADGAANAILAAAEQRLQASLAGSLGYGDFVVRREEPCPQ